MERIYTLPRPQPAGNLVIVHLENAMRRGQTYYEWICFFFDPAAHEELELGADDEVRLNGCLALRRCAITILPHELQVLVAHCVNGRNCARDARQSRLNPQRMDVATA